MAKTFVFLLGLILGVSGTYFFLTRVWWPDVRFPGVVPVLEAPREPSPPGASPEPEAPPIEITEIEAHPSEPLPSPPLAEVVPTPEVGERVPQLPASPSPAEPLRAEPPVLTSDLDRLRTRSLLLPVKGVDPRTLRDAFADDRGGRSHAAIDILAPRGTPIVATEDGHVEKLFTSKQGGLTLYQFDPQGEYCYYYAHLDSYAAGMVQGKTLTKGEVIGYVGTTGNAPPGTPHLHFAIFRVGAQGRWWEGTAINAYPLWGNLRP